MVTANKSESMPEAGMDSVTRPRSRSSQPGSATYSLSDLGSSRSSIDLPNHCVPVMLLSSYPMIFCGAFDAAHFLRPAQCLCMGRETRHPQVERVSVTTARRVESRRKCALCEVLALGIPTTPSFSSAAMCPSSRFLCSRTTRGAILSFVDTGIGLPRERVGQFSRRRL